MSNFRLVSCIRNMYFYECEVGEIGISIVAIFSRFEEFIIYEFNIREIKID